ncbi:glutathione S-transferase family protein [Epibacterium ulvae]|uniref:glutathione S-transferase family protein n=1 Tax=Epibacterium ulvae TaxID=1156985 RepID=UPI001BFC232E|nr:glutathione S-transferase family protein [Epibacterium ulvae]MBT8152336.1 glutathione S-transferase family protein [Epibacterium ulvae]
MTQPYRLHYAPDNASLIIRLVLEELGLPFETFLVDRRTSEQRSEAYLKLNPAGKIPTLETVHGPVSEVGAILIYLSETHGILAPPVGDTARPAFLKWLFFTTNTLHPDLAMLFYLHRFGPAEAITDMHSCTTNRLISHLSLLDEAAGTTPWFAAEQPSVVDYYVAACLRWAALYPITGTGWFDLSAYPNLQGLAQNLETRPAVRVAIQAEGLGPTPFSSPQYPNPPEGVAL